MAKRHRIPGTRSGPVLLVLPEIADDLDAETKNGLAIRNAASVSGVCPDCGAEGEVHADEEYEGLLHMVFEHEVGCGVLTDGAAA